MKDHKQKAWCTKIRINVEPRPAPYTHIYTHHSQTVEFKR